MGADASRKLQEAYEDLLAQLALAALDACAQRQRRHRNGFDRRARSSNRGSCLSGRSRGWSPRASSSSLRRRHRYPAMLSLPAVGAKSSSLQMGLGAGDEVSPTESVFWTALELDADALPARAWGFVRFASNSRAPCMTRRALLQCLADAFELPLAFFLPGPLLQRNDLPIGADALAAHASSKRLTSRGAGTHERSYKIWLRNRWWRAHNMSATHDHNEGHQERQSA